jgi:hypothetical protein
MNLSLNPKQSEKIYSNMPGAKLWIAILNDGNHSTVKINKVQLKRKSNF